MPDLGAPLLVDARSWVDELVARLEAGEGLILHCAGGIGRAPTMGTCVLVRLGMQPEEALALVAASRPMAGPEAGSQRALVEAFA